MKDPRTPCGHLPYNEETDHCAEISCDNYIAKCILWPNHPAVKNND